MQETKIPKIIHYCWFGNGKKSSMIKKCMKSWKKYCPDYEIREWNNDDLESCENTYVKEAFEAKKWAFVSDYFRLKALSEYGGIYLDTDVEMTNSLDEFMDNDFFIGQEIYKGKFFNLGTATIGAAKGNSIINGILNEYSQIHFIKEDGSYDTTITSPVRYAGYLAKEYNVKNLHLEQEKIEFLPNSFIYPWYYFCAKKKGNKNYTIHHFDGSWKDSLLVKLKKRIQKMFVK